jgi:hypothetical protein
MTLCLGFRTPEPRVRMGQIMSLFVKLTLEEIYTGVTKIQIYPKRKMYRL